jgi:signal transduction histidine kinase
MALEATIFLCESDPKMVARNLEKAIVNLNAAISDLRSYVEWGGTNIKAEQLTEALRQLIQMVATADLVIDLEIDAISIKELSDHMATHILNIVREALTNTLRHANATSSKVSLIRANEVWHLDVIDDGIGFDTAPKDGYGWGLRNMAARAEKLDAKFHVTSECGRGTRISVDIPRIEHAKL